MILLTNLMSSPLSFVRWHPVSKEKVSLNCSQIKLVASYKMIHIYLGNIFSPILNQTLCIVRLVVKYCFLQFLKISQLSHTHIIFRMTFFRLHERFEIIFYTNAHTTLIILFFYNHFLYHLIIIITDKPHTHTYYTLII